MSYWQELFHLKSSARTVTAKKIMMMTKMMTVFVIQSTKFQISLILVSWLGLHFLLKVIPQTLINVLLRVTFQLKNILVTTVSTIPVAYCISMLVFNRPNLIFTSFFIVSDLTWFRIIWLERKNFGVGKLVKWLKH